MSAVAVSRPLSRRVMPARKGGPGVPLVHGGLSRTSDSSSFSEEEIRRDQADHRHWSLRHLQKILYFADVDGSLRGCLQGTFERWSKAENCLVNRAEVHSYGGRLHWVGIAHCKNPLCPVCGPILAAKRLDEARQAAEYLLKHGFSYIFPTYTASHGPDVKLIDERVAFSKAFEYFYNTAEYKRVRRKYKWKFSFLAYEVTDDDPSSGPGKRSGWHLHRHGVLWMDRAWLTEEETEKVRLLLLAGWKKALAKVGLSCSDDRGVYMETMQGFLRRRGLEKPFDELSEETQKKIIDKVCGYISKSLGFEMTATGRKTGKRNKYGGNRVSHWRLMEMAIMGDKRARARWLELFESCQEKRLSTFRMSQGLREFCHMEKEKTDEELMSETEAARPVLIFGPYRDDQGRNQHEFKHDFWKVIARQGRLAHFCSILEDSVADPVPLARALLQAAGCGFDIKSEKWLDQSGLDSVWEGLECGMVAKTKPWPEAQARLDAEEKAARDVSRQAAIDSWLFSLAAYDEGISKLKRDFREHVMRYPELYAVGRVTKEKKVMWDRVLRHGFWGLMCGYLRDVGYVPPPDRPDDAGPEQAWLVA